jgi:hypothetical protein
VGQSTTTGARIAFARRLCAALGATATPERIRFLVAWQAAENTAAAFNPLATTLRLPGSTGFNRSGVQNYQDELMGLAATLLTLRLDYYSDLIHAISANGSDANAIARAGRRGLDTWGTGYALVSKVLQHP